MATKYLLQITQLKQPRARAGEKPPEEKLMMFQLYVEQKDIARIIKSATEGQQDEDES